MNLRENPVWHWVRRHRARQAVQASPLFQPQWYCARYPDVAAAGLDPLAHYLGPGGWEGRAPSAAFDGARYLADHPDVARTGCNPLVHYLLRGRAEGRSCHPIPPGPVAAGGAEPGAFAFCTVVDARAGKRALAHGLVASWHRFCRAWSSLHVVLIGQDPDFTAFARRLGATITERSPHPLSEQLAFANKWLVADLDVGSARPVLIDWDIVFVGDPWLLRALPAHCFGARPAPALRLPPALQHWAMAQFGLPRGLNIAAMEVAARYGTAWGANAGSSPEIAREFRYHNGGLLAVPPGRLREVMLAWQDSYERLADRIRTTPGAMDLPAIEESALASDQLALAMTLCWEDVHPLDATSNFFLFDPKFGYASHDVAILHLAGPAVGHGLPALLDTFDDQWRRWRLDPRDFPRFDPHSLRGTLEALVRDYGPGGAALREGPPAAAAGSGAASDTDHARHAVDDSLYDNRPWVEAAVAQGHHREVVGGMWGEIGRLQSDYLKDNGLLPHHHLIDIGCGSLRGGTHLAAYLDPGHYWGVDAHASLLRAGRKELEDASLSDRVPAQNLLEETEFDFARFGQQFDVALAQSLFTHLSTNRIRLCLYRLAKVLRPHGRLFATCFEVPEDHPLDEPFHHPGGIVSFGHKDTFHYHPSAIATVFAGMPWRLVAIGDWGHPRGQRMMVMERQPSETGTRP